MTHFWQLGEKPPDDTPHFAITAHDGVILYLKNFLTADHPYRSGSVCPFMPRVLAANNIFFTYFDSRNTDQELDQLIRHCINFYKNNRQGSFGAVLILFEDDFDIYRLLRAHINSKINCIKNEFMLGALYKESQAPSLHSDKYFPLRTPTPTLVIRDIVPHDLKFLQPNHYGIFSKIKLLNSFINKFSHPSKQEKSWKKVNEAIQLRRKYYFIIFLRSAFITASIAFLFLVSTSGS